MKHKISVFTLAMMNVAIVMNLRGLPLMAKEGLPLISYLLFSTLFLLLPVSLVSAELATGWPDGGVYRWVKAAFGDHLGFIAIFLQWIQNVVWYPTILAFAAGALAYCFSEPLLGENRWFNVAVIWIIYWGATLFNFRGLRVSGIISSIAVIGGTLIPGLVMIIFGCLWFFMGKPITFLQNPQFLPDLSSFSSIAFLSGIVLLFAGMEVSAVHANEIQEPQKKYPKAILLSVVLILLIFFLGSLSIAAVIAPDSINLTIGIMQAYQFMLQHYHLEALLPVFGFLIALGSIGGVTSWIIGPSKGLLQTAKEGDIPPFLAKTNQNGVPTHILYIQGAIVSALSLLYLFTKDVQTAFFMLTALTAILYLIMYILLYAAAIRLRYKFPSQPRSYRVFGGNLGMWFVGVVGIFAALFALIVGFFPPIQLKIVNAKVYVLTLLFGGLFFIAIPLLVMYFRNPSWKQIKRE